MSTPSPGQRTHSMSPNAELAPMNGMQRHMGDYPYMNNSSLPVHLRNDYAQHVPMQNAPLPQKQSQYPNSQRPTSHPTGYGPPQILEPPANPQSSGSQSGGSPHMSNAGWHSPSNMPSPTSQSNGGYVYPDPDPYGSGAMGHMYYPNSNIRRPQSTEPDSYETKPRLNELWTAAQ